MSKNYLPKTLPSFFWYFIKRQWIGLTILLVTILAWSVQEAIYPYFIKLIIDNIESFAGNKKEIFTVLSSLLIKAISIVLLIEASYRIHDFATMKVMPKFRANIRAAMFEYTIHHSYKYFTEHFAGTISARIARISESAEQIISLVITVFVPVIGSFIISSILLFQAKPLFALIVTIWFIGHLLITITFASKCRIYSARHSHQVTLLHGKIVDCITNIVNVRLFSNHKFEKRYFKKFQNDEIKSAEDSLYYNAMMKACLGLASMTFICLMVGFGIHFWKIGIISIGDLALILSYQSLIGLMWYMGMDIITVYDLLGNCSEALNLINKQYEVTDKPNFQGVNYY